MVSSDIDVVEAYDLAMVEARVRLPHVALSSQTVAAA